MVGDNDEESYIWPALGKPTTLNEEKLNQRRIELISNTTRYILEHLPFADISV